MKATIFRLFFLLGSGLLVIGARLFSGVHSDEASAFAPLRSGNAIPAADFHLWVINEIFSCADGSIQFIEMTTTTNGQHVLMGHELQATNGIQTNTFTFPTNSGSPTTNKSLLIATTGFGSLPGGVTPDFTIPANFLFLEGGSLSLIGANTLNYGPGALPLDGLMSLGRGGVTSINSPKNFAGQQGSIMCPLVISKKGPMTIISGNLITYTLMVTSSGPLNNTNVVLTDTIPSGTSLVAADVTPINGILTWTLGNMSSPSVISRTFVVAENVSAGNMIINSDYGVRSNQSKASGSEVQTLVIGTTTDALIYLPVIFKNSMPIGEHAADLIFDSP